jgi:hypothetical protein
VAIGLLFRTVLSMICSGIVELFASWLKWRSRNLICPGQSAHRYRLLKTVVNDPLIRAMGQSSSDQRGQERARSDWKVVELHRINTLPSPCCNTSCPARLHGWTLDLGQVRQNAIALAWTAGWRQTPRGRPL